MTTVIENFLQDPNIVQLPGVDCIITPMSNMIRGMKESQQATIAESLDSQDSSSIDTEKDDTSDECGKGRDISVKECEESLIEMEESTLIPSRIAGALGRHRLVLNTIGEEQDEDAEPTLVTMEAKIPVSTSFSHFRSTSEPGNSSEAKSNKDGRRSTTFGGGSKSTMVFNGQPHNASKEYRRVSNVFSVNWMKQMTKDLWINPDSTPRNIAEQVRLHFMYLSCIFLSISVELIIKKLSFRYVHFFV